MMPRCGWLLVALLVWIGSYSAYAGNPFLSKSKHDEQETISEEQSSDKSAELRSAYPWIPSWFAPVLRITNLWQRDLKRRLSAYARDMKEHPFGASLLWFLFVSFLYGAVHAIGPGHGKSVVMSYFLNRPASWKQGVVLANLITSVHVGAGVAVVGGMVLFLDSTRIVDFEAISPTMERVSYGLLVLVGLMLLAHAVLDLHRSSPDQENDKPLDDWKSMVAMALATGLVPCPGAALVLLFSVITGVVFQGLLAMVLIALGMGLTTSLFALIAIGSRKSALAVARVNTRAVQVTHGVLSIGAALTVMALGAVLFLSAG